MFLPSIEEHTAHLTEVIKTLKRAPMKISLEKSRFFELEVEFLGYRVGSKVIKTDPKKLKLFKHKNKEVFKISRILAEILKGLRVFCKTSSRIFNRGE